MTSKHLHLSERMQELNLQGLFEQAPALIAILSGRDGVVELFNPQFKKLWGNRPVLGKAMRQAFPELEGQGWFDYVEEVFKTGKPIRGFAVPASFDRDNNGRMVESFFDFVHQPYRNEKGVVVGVMVFGVEVTDQVQARERALESEQRYQAFIHNSQEGIWRFEVEEPIPIKLKLAQQIDLMYERAYLAEANDAMAAMYGAESAASLMGMRLPELLVRDDPLNTAYLKAFIQSGYSLSGVDSHELDTHGNKKVFRNSLVGVIEDGKLIRAWGTQQDITTQYRAETALRRSEENLALALKASQMGMWEWNIATNELVWSDELKALFGLKPAYNITYEKYLRLLHPAERSLTRKVIQDAMKTGKEYRVEHRVVWPDGTVHWLLGQGKALLENGKAVRMIGTSMNIDDRKNAEIELYESEQRFRSMADSASVLMWLSDTEKRRTYFNKSWLDYTGRTLEQELGNGWAQSVHPEDASRCLKVYIASFDEHKPFNMEYRLRRYDGTYRWILDNGLPRFSPEGEFLGYIGSCVDIEDIKRAEELKAMNAVLESQHAQLVALNNSKDEFISLASHQLRTPATGVKQYIGMLLEGYAGRITRQQRAFLEVAYDSNERQLHIIDDLLKVAHVDAGQVVLEKREVDLITLISDVIAEQSSSFQLRQQAVSFNRPKSKILVRVDPTRMRMVLENLIDNASKYTPAGKRIAISIASRANDVQITVEDQGVGISQKDVAKLFKKFSRIDNELSTLVGGTGLGLYWAKKVVDLHGGTISVTSRLRSGSVFTIKLPKSSREA
ncbi:MAG TPA: PAS domain S-box protein [Candidatus Saccharimonadales bacterium]|nr:PAS domain S-box protein [Candidatus Saccharimonadales bacterium]